MSKLQVLVLFLLKHDSELGNAHAHSLFDRLTVAADDPASPARAFTAYSVLFDGKAVEVGQSLQAAPGVTLIRRC
jgi:CRISPR-associated protein Csd2